MAIELVYKGGISPVKSVNGKTGDVVLTAEDVGALPIGTEIPNPDWMATKECNGGNTVYIAEQKLTTGVWNKLQASFETGILYDVFINGEVFTCEARVNGTDGIIIGNNLDFTFNELPFCISWAGGKATSGMFFKNESISYPITLKVTDHAEVTYNKMPVEYLPEEAALKSDVPSLSGYATEEFVNEAINNIDIPTGGGIQPDFEQNDSAAADYIKNRPFYEAIEEVVLFEDSNLELPNGFNNIVIDNLSEGDYFLYVGDSVIKGKYQFIGSPFFDNGILFEDGTSYCWGNFILSAELEQLSGNYPVKLVANAVTIKQIDNKYISGFISYKENQDLSMSEINIARENIGIYRIYNEDVYYADFNANLTSSPLIISKDYFLSEILFGDDINIFFTLYSGDSLLAETCIYLTFYSSTNELRSLNNLRFYVDGEILVVNCLIELNEEQIKFTIVDDENLNNRQLKLNRIIRKGFGVR